MKKFVALFLLVLTPVLFAKDRNWQDAKVRYRSDSGRFWMLSGPIDTYQIDEPRALLTVGGTARIYSDGKNVHFVDNQGKERKSRIVNEWVNAVAEDLLAKEMAKSPEQKAAEHMQREQLRLQQEALRQQKIQDSINANKMQPIPPVQLNLPDPPQRIHCTSTQTGNTVDTNCH